MAHKLSKDQRRRKITSADHAELVGDASSLAATHGLTAHATRGKHGSHLWFTRDGRQVLHFWPRRGTIFFPATRITQGVAFHDDMRAIVLIAAGVASGPRRGERC